MDDVRAACDVFRATFERTGNGDGTVSVPPNGATFSVAGNVMRSPGGAGTYTVNARSQGQNYRRTFAVRSGDNTPVEVLAQ